MSSLNCPYLPPVCTGAVLAAARLLDSAQHALPLGTPLAYSMGRLGWEEGSLGLQVATFLAM